MLGGEFWGKGMFWSIVGVVGCGLRDVVVSFLLSGN